MTTKKSKSASVKKPAAALPETQPLSSFNARELADIALRPSLNAALVTEDYMKAVGELDIGMLTASLSAGMKDVNAGDMRRAETMLYGQAHALQAIFTNLARRAVKQEYLKQWDAYLRMALKAQNQCRMTLETLATIKNPPVVFARQANINNGGQQQVNNGAVIPASTVEPAANANDAPNKLLEASDGERLDTRTAGTASGAYPHLETVGAVHRTANG